MPLYTYVVTFENSTYVGQASHSNFRGFVSAWCTEMPDTALAGFNSKFKKLLSSKAYQGEFSPIPNRKNVWRKTIDLEGKILEVVAVETKP